MSAIFKDHQTPYALVRFYGDRKYGHMEVRIRNLIGKDGWRDPIIVVTSQIGTDDPSYTACLKPYGIKIGLEFPDNMATTATLEDGLKLSKKLDRNLQKLRDDLGYADGLSETIWRVIVASGVDFAFLNLNWGGGYGQLTDLPTHRLSIAGEKGRLRESLESMERTLVGNYSKQAA